MPAWALLAVSLTLGIPVAYTIVRGRERGRQERARQFERELAHELLQQASALDRLVAVLGSLADSRNGDSVLDQSVTEARRLLHADDAILLHAMADGVLRVASHVVEERPELGTIEVVEPDAAARIAAASLNASACHATPLAAHDELIGVLVVARRSQDGEPARPFSPAELAQLRVLADFAARAAQNARLYARLDRLKTEAESRERERARLSNQLAEAEQAERRRLALLLHDGPQQTITSASLLLEACLEALDADEPAEVHRILSIARDRNREAVRDLRELSWSLEPPVLRDEGLTAALLPLCTKLGEAHEVRFQLDVEAAEDLDNSQQTFVYQIIREAIANAIKHGRPRRIAITASRDEAAGIILSVADDGLGMMGTGDGMSQGMDAMRERAMALGGSIEWVAPGEGTQVLLRIPPPGMPHAA
jgi:signal transduction histidine kinase